MKKVLIITYYWPPSGGAGVQRWLKLTRYLTNYGINPYVLTVHEKYASYMAVDTTLSSEISENIHVYKTKSFEPINWYAKIAGKENVPTAGFSNVNNEKISQKIINALRSNFFIPDPRRGWNYFAMKKASEIIEKENIDTIITTSPPHSSQLIGYKLKKKYNIKWIADFRDPWTDIYYYKLLNHSFLSKAIDKKYEKKVLSESDKITTVSQRFRDLFSSKMNNADNKITVIPNGYDEEDFEHVKRVYNDKFVISYTGTMSEQYNPYTFLNEFKNIAESYKNVPIVLRFVGLVFEKLKDDIKKLGIEENVEFIATVSHQKSIEYIVNSNALLLVIPEIQNNEGIVPGKLYEYLATGNPIICIGDTQSDAAKIIHECQAGKTFSRNSNTEIYRYLSQLIELYIQNAIPNPNRKKIAVYSRKAQAEEFSNLIHSLQ